MTLLQNPNTESLQDHTLFEQAAEMYQDNPDLLVLGSVGRAAIMGHEVPAYRPSGVKRDIDVARIGDRSGGRPGEDGNVDYIFEDWIADDGSYLVFPHDQNVYVPVRHPEVFAPYIRKVGDLEVPTPHHDVLGRINTMQYIQRPKDRRAAEAYGAFLDSRTDHLPAELLEPFDTLHDTLSRNRSYRARAVLRNGYHNVVPEQVRYRLQLGERIGWLRQQKPSS